MPFAGSKLSLRLIPSGQWLVPLAAADAAANAAAGAAASAAAGAAVNATASAAIGVTALAHFLTLAVLHVATHPSCTCPLSDAACTACCNTSKLQLPTLGRCL